MDESSEFHARAHRIRQRQKQINIGYGSTVYSEYLALVSKDERKLGDPVTPRPDTDHSKRSFDGLIRQWKTRLHEWREKHVASTPSARSSSSSSSSSSSRETTFDPDDEEDIFYPDQSLERRLQIERRLLPSFLCSECKIPVGKPFKCTVCENVLCGEHCFDQHFI
jgi:hypothetical protein